MITEAHGEKKRTLQSGKVLKGDAVSTAFAFAFAFAFLTLRPRWLRPATRSPVNNSRDSVFRHKGVGCRRSCMMPGDMYEDKSTTPIELGRSVACGKGDTLFRVSTITTRKYRSFAGMEHYCPQDRSRASSEPVGTRSEGKITQHTAHSTL